MTHTPKPFSHRLGLLAVALAILVILPSAAFAASGGPDGFGYTWRDLDDGITVFPLAFNATLNLRSAPYNFVGDDVVTGSPVTIPPFPFYGTTYTSAWLSSNGFLSFVNPAGISYPIPTGLPNAGLPNGLLAFLWDDLQTEGGSPAAFAGPNTAGDGFTFVIQLYSKIDPTRGTRVVITLFNNGIIQLKYYAPENPALLLTPSSMAGTEAANGLNGLMFIASGVPQGGANFRPDYAVQIYPRGNLDCTNNVTPITCASGTISSNNTAGTNRVTNYNCAAGTYAAPEKVFSITLAQMSDLTITLTNTDGRNRHAFLMRANCSEVSGCIIGAATVLNPRFVAPGTFYIVVDGVLATDVGNFNLAVTCQASSTLASCNANLTAQTTSGTNAISNWSCAGGLTGPEKLYEVNLTGGPATLTARLSNESTPDLYAVLIDGSTFNPIAPTCLAGDTSTAVAFNLNNGQYFVAVDALNGSSGSFDLAIDCGRELFCPSPANVIDVANPTTVFGDTSITGLSNVDAYYCGAAGAGGVVTAYTGPEDVYEFTLTSTRTVGFQLTTANPDLRLLLLGNCYEGNCIQEGGCAEALPPGTYHLVVDGLNGAQGAYALTPYSSVPITYNRWYDCPEVANLPGQNPSSTLRTRWGFDDNTYCGTGCNFSMFAIVECGTEFHIPFWDVETGNMSVTDVLTQQMMTLTATNNLPVNGAPRPPCTSWMTTTGTSVSWADRGCPGAAGNDCWTNDVVMDVSFSGNPTVCGVYQLNFRNWGGFVWDVYANCSQNRTEQYFIARDLCSAISNYHPRPEVGLVTGTFTQDLSQCSLLRASGTIDLQNVGCVAAVNYPLVIEQAPPAPPNPQTILVNLASGQQATIPWSYTLSTVPGGLVFRVDPNNVVAECSEGIGSTVACGSVALLLRTSPQVSCGVVCGNGTLEPGEGCDDGNTVSGDGCRANCTIEECGDGILDVGEFCDDGNMTPGDGCRADCTIERCGDGILDSPESCDDNNNTSGDGCRADCTIEMCGDGITDASEECDDGNSIPNDGCTNCILDTCTLLSIQPIRYVFAIKSADWQSVVLTYAPDAAAANYNTWFVDLKQNIASARLGSGIGQRPVGCDPTPATACWHFGAIPEIPAGPLLYYQVRGMCGSLEAAE